MGRPTHEAEDPGRTLYEAAAALETWNIKISEFERGLIYDGDLASRYLALLGRALLT